MAITDWGGGGNLSGLFASLQDQFQARIEASKARAIRQSEEDQAAEDAETHDKWMNGIIEDDVWLDYIRNRMEESKGEPDKLQQWTEMFRKHSDAINDGQLEQQYLEGSISIHELVSHYDTRRQDIERNSPEYRELSSRYFDLVDRRDADFIDQQASSIVDRIERGQASYNELLTFYQSMQSKVRSTSPLAAQIRRQITNIKQIVDGVTGAGSAGGSRGGGRGTARRGSAGGGGDTDVVTDIARANELVSEYYRQGNVFVPTGQRVVSSVFDRFEIENTTKNILDAMEADSRYIEEMMNSWKDNPDDPILTMNTGQQIPNTPEMRWGVYNQAIANYDYRIQLMNATGDWDGAAIVYGARKNFVEGVMQVDNSISMEPYWAVRRETFNQGLNLAAVASDPDSALNLYEKVGRSFSNQAQRLISRSDSAISAEKFDPDFLEELNYSKELGNLFENAENMDVEEILTVGSMLHDQLPSGYYLTEENITNIIGNTDGPTGSGLAGQAAARDGHKATLDIRAGFVATSEPWVYVARAGESVGRLVKRSEVSSYLGIEGNDWMASTRPFAERVSIREQPVLVYRALEELEFTGWDKRWYQDKWGSWVSYEEVADIGRDAAAIAENEWSLVEVPELVGWQSVTDSQGQVWYVDPSDGLLYERLPFRAGISGTFDVSDLVDSSGKMNLERVQGAQGLAMGVTGVDLRWAQNLLNRAAASGEVDLELYHDRDIATGRVEFAPFSMDDVEGTLWSPADSANERFKAAGRQVGRRLTEMGHPDAIRRELAMRNNERREGRIREWFDQQDFNRIAFKEVNESLRAGDTAIDFGSRSSGVMIARPQRMIDQPDVPLPFAKKFDVPDRPDQPAIRPVNIDTIRSPSRPPSDPKIREPLPSGRATSPLERPRYAEPPPTVPSSRRPVIR